jgi:hypothetical protein
LAGQSKHRTLFRAYEKSASWFHLRDTYDYAMSQIGSARPFLVRAEDQGGALLPDASANIISTRHLNRLPAVQAGLALLSLPTAGRFATRTPARENDEGG